MSQSLLKVQIGPVQEFIAQARSTRDLWSGSYLLSWLMAAGISRLAQDVAALTKRTPVQSLEAVIYPDLCEQPLVTRRLTVDLGNPIVRGEDNNAVLTPNLPNLLVAKIGADTETASRIANAVEKAIRDEWQTIAQACWEKAKAGGIIPATATGRFQSQVAHFLSISWRVTPWEDAAPYAHPYKRNAWELDAVRQTRGFRAWRPGGWATGLEMNKDTLTGREEMLLGGSEWWNMNADRVRGLWSVLLRRKHEGDFLGAITLIKRTWHWHYLKDAKWGLLPLHESEASPWRTQFPFPSTLHIAQHDPTKTETDETREPDEDSDRLSRYFAVVALDGDRIGSWLGGEFHELTEGFHRDFSRRLANFALHCVLPIVVACDGRLIYAGGDDVLALLPADTALECARLLRMAYCGDAGFIEPMTQLAGELLEAHQRGGKRLPTGHQEEISPMLVAAANDLVFADVQGRVARKGQSTALDLPGEVAGHNEQGQTIHPDASVGISIAHFKDPLQDVIREAQAAEKRAKNQLGRSAVAVTLFKRSGETVEWGCNWAGGGLDAYRAVADALDANKLSAKFPYRAAELLQPYLTETSQLIKQSQSLAAVEGFDKELREIIGRDLGVALSRQTPLKGDEKRALIEELTPKLEAYIKHLEERFGHAVAKFEKRLSDRQAKPWEGPSKPDFVCGAVIGLCQTVAFAKRAPDESTHAQPV
jgi:hypothetical protein